MTLTLLLLTLIACRPDEGEDSASAPLPCAEASSALGDGPFVVVEAGTAAVVEVDDGQTYRVLADGDCVQPEVGDELCPLWDLTLDHEVVDGYLETVGSGLDGRVVDTTDRDWRVYVQ